MLMFAFKKLLQPRLIPRLFFGTVATAGSQIGTLNQKTPNFGVSYLVESCGLSPEAAKCLHLGLSDIPEALRFVDRSKDVILTFKDLGFHDYLITKLVLKKPYFLLCDCGKELKPKIELLASLGSRPSTSAEILLNFPDRHLRDGFVPFVDFLRNMCFTNEEVIEMMNSICRFDGFDLEVFWGNMAILREVGVSDSIVAHFIRTDTRKSMLFMQCGLFKKIVDEVKVMGINPKRCVFVDAMLKLSVIGVETYQQKSMVFKKWGCLDDELLKAFVEKPQLLRHAERKIDEVIECFVKTLGFKSSVVLQCPWAFTCSKSKLISRFSVAKFLWDRGVIEVDSYKMSSFLETDER